MPVWFNAVTGDEEPGKAPAWLTVRAEFRSTPLGTQGVQERVMQRLERAGWPNPVVSVSNNGTDGILGWGAVPAAQTSTVKLLRDGATQAQAADAVAAAFKPEQLDNWQLLAAYAAELREEVVKPTLEDAADLAKDALDEAGSFAWKALPWWAWAIAVVVGIGALLYLARPLFVLLGAKRSSSGGKKGAPLLRRLGVA